LVDLGLPTPSSSAFERDPEVKREIVFTGDLMRPASTLVRRLRPAVQLRTGSGWQTLTDWLPSHRSMLTEFADPDQAPELLAVRDQIRSWRFYDGFRVDASAPVRQSQVGTRTPVLADDGSDLAAAIQTIIEQGPSGPRSDGDLSTAIADAFDGAQVEVSAYNGVFEISLRQPGMLRPLRAAELSDGTLRYLLWAAALLTVDPPGLMVLNEPETSLHPDLLPALGRLISRAADRTQLLVVSHSRPLIQHLGLSGSLQGESDRREIELVKDLGETRIPGQGLLTTPVWSWGSR